MRILVTGGLGFIGSHLVDKLVADGNDVVVLDALKTGAKIAYSNPKVHYFITDLGTKPSEVMEFCRAHPVDQVYHLAAETHVDRAINNADPFIRSNINGTYNLFRALNSFTRDRPKVLLFSTDEVMGELDSGSFAEDDLTAPKNMYSMTKLAQEGIARSFAASHGMDVVITRCSNIYGPRQHPEKFLPVILKSLYSNKKVPIYGDGKNVREWTYVDDAVHGAIFAMKSFSNTEIVHIGSNVEKMNIEVVKSILQKLDMGHEYITYVEDRKGHDRRYSLDTSKLRTKGWRPRYDFERGLDLTMKWYSENRSFLG